MKTPGRRPAVRAIAATAPFVVWMWAMHGWRWAAAMAVGGLAVCTALSAIQLQERQSDG